MASTPDPTATPPPHLSPLRLALGVGFVAWVLVLATLGDPGITIDEPLDVRPGRTYVAALRTWGLGFFDRRVVDAVFRDNAEHPPLGRWLLGIASTLGQPFEALLSVKSEPDPIGLYIHQARIAPATIFAALMALIVHATARRYGTVAGLSAGFALIVMPRVFAHAHLGALDTFITFFWVSALFTADRALEHRRPLLMMIPAGLAFSLALLTKLHAWFLIPIVLLLAIAKLRLRQGILAWLIWATTGFVGFFLGWPWLWYAPRERLLKYLGTGVDRISIQVEYFSQVYADRDVPWHYPWVYFAITVPLGLHLLGAIGLFQGFKHWRIDRFPILLLGAILLFLGLFSTRVPVYDGVRLFLMVFPLWAIFIGRGFATLWNRWPKVGIRLILGGFLLAQAYGVITIHPFGLSYYNEIVGGLAGADRLGLERTYWGDAVDRVLLDKLVSLAPAESDAALVPTLYPNQGLSSTTRAMARDSILLRDEDAARNATWVVVSRREAYWKPPFRARMERGEVVFERSRRGVWLSRIYWFGPRP